jgi:hypothetical protein
MKLKRETSMRPRNAIRAALTLGLSLSVVVWGGPKAVAATPAQLRIEAETEVEGPGVVNYGYGISYVDNGDWVRYAGVDFGVCGFYQTFSALIATPYAGNVVHVRLDSLSGREVATLVTSASGTDWQNFSIETAPLQPVSGVHDLYLSFDGSANVGKTAQGSGNGIGNFDWFQLLNNFAPAPTSRTCDPVVALVDQLNQLSTQLSAVQASLQNQEIRLQVEAGHENPLIQTLSNILKTVSQTNSAILQNLQN